MVHCTCILCCKVGLSQNQMKIRFHSAGMEIKIPFFSICRVSSFSVALTFTFWVLVWSIQTQKSVEFILICRCKVFRVFVSYHGMTLKNICCCQRRRCMWCGVGHHLVSASLSPGYNIGNTVITLVACRKMCSGVPKLQETSCLLHWCRKICSSCFLCLSLTRGHTPCAVHSSAWREGMDFNLKFRLPFNCFIAWNQDCLFIIISSVVSQQ